MIISPGLNNSNRQETIFKKPSVSQLSVSSPSSQKTQCVPPQPKIHESPPWWTTPDWKSGQRLSWTTVTKASINGVSCFFAASMTTSLTTWLSICQWTFSMSPANRYVWIFNSSSTTRSLKCVTMWSSHRRCCCLNSDPFSGTMTFTFASQNCTRNLSSMPVFTP